MPLTQEEKKARNKLAVKKYRERNKEKIAAYKALKKEEAAAYARAYHIKNKEKNNAKAAAWYALNTEKVKERTAAHYRANKEEILRSHKEWRKNNPEKTLELKRKWVKANPDRARELGRIKNINRASRKASSGGRISTDIVKRLFKLQRGKCACCGRPLGDSYDLDHIMPLALGGANSDENMQLLTSRCNRQKHMKHPVDFMQSRGFLL